MKSVYSAAGISLFLLMGLTTVARAEFLATDWAISGAPSRLYRVNPLTGNVTTIGVTGVTRLVGLVVDVDNTIYGLSEEANSGLFRLNPKTGTGTLVGRLGFNFQEGDL